ncbi:structural maintenance of chromosomes protein 6-like isoform X1 [Musca domestica]|uniref:Structural maintenance of chromosomes protein 6-like isoform X1 n=1 Tax=Musca domestica TaxID=7370 RepID=A0ABM3UM13_MUSDO|nr:structural maintenance of chromosomes protein 6-like isoform X1 [Musca domestica]
MSSSLVRKRRISGGGVNDSQTAPTKRRLTQNNSTQSQGANTSIIQDKRCGKILLMHLTNFMCHSNLTVEFHSRVNFLVGSNGSGKSAILAALVLGLGGSARTTNRSRSAKAFIKNGETSAKIEIVLANDGAQPYEPDVYGDKIIIVRTISLSSGSYVIKSESGQVVSKKVDDLHRILMYHNVQVDNPVFLLNQDSAREFLKELEPSKNYQLFLKATQIDVVHKKLTDSLHLHKDHMEELKNYEIRLKKEKEDIAEHENKLKDVLKRLEIELAWRKVQQFENQLQEISDKLAKYDEKERELKNLIQNKDEVYQILSQEIRKDEEGMTLKNSNYDKVNREYRELKNKYDEINKLTSEFKNSLDILKKKKSRLEHQIEEIKKYIDEKSQGNQDDVETLRAQNQNETLKLRQQCESQVIPMIENIKRELKRHIDSKAQKEQIVNEIKRRQRKYLDEIRLRSGQIANVKASAKNKILIYGKHMPELLTDIRKAHSQGLLSKLPRGPIGSYVDVANSQYRDVIENSIGRGLLGAFLVNNAKDRQILENIFTKYENCRPIIITVAFSDKVYDVSGGCVNPPKDTHLLLHEIRCSDATVMNCLIDRLGIESILLTNSKEIAETITSHIENVPKNLSRVLVLKEGNSCMEYYPMPKYRMYSNKVRPANYIQINIEERIRHLENEKQSLELKNKSYETDLSQMINQISQVIKLIQEQRELLIKQQNASQEIMEKIAELDNIEYADYSNEIQLLEKEMGDYKTRLAEIEQKISETRGQLSDVDNEKIQIGGELQFKEIELQEIKNDIEAFKSTVDRKKMKLRSVNNNDSSYRVKLSEVQDVINKLKAEHMEMSRKVDACTKSAAEKGERIESDLSGNQLQDEISKKAKNKHGKPVSFDPQSMRQLIMTKKEALLANEGKYEDIKHSIYTLRQSLRFSFEFLKKLREHMSLLLQISFNMILRLRNFEGSLDVNHQQKTLKLSVKPRCHNKNAVSDTKSLSGGERSFTTAAFLLSLWSCVDHPFYFLDDNDVFTDEVNREYMTRLLIDEGRRRPLRQYSFLTPQDMALMSEDFIKILRLEEPERV